MNKLIRFIFIWLIGCCSIAHAHLMPKGKGTINLINNTAYVVLSLPVEIFEKYDNNKDLRLSADELQQRHTDIKQQFTQKATLISANNVFQWKEILLSLPTQGEHNNIDSDQLLVMAIGQFNKKPQFIDVKLNLVNHATAYTSPDSIRIQATISKGLETLDSDIGLISADYPSFRFFATPAMRVASFIKLGIHHILTGWDHLLFLLVLLSASLVWRRWLWLLLTFTIAHGTTFTLMTMGWIKISSNWVEPSIAASIVLLTGLQLLQCTTKLKHEMFVVFTVGLIHGLGFASALQFQGSEDRHPWVSILSFNLGIEIGQIAMALMVWVLMKKIRPLFNIGSEPKWQISIASFAMVMGAIWFVQRVC